MSISNLPNACTDCAARGRKGLVITVKRLSKRKEKDEFQCVCVYCGKAGDWVADKKTAILNWNQKNTLPEV